MLQIGGWRLLIAELSKMDSSSMLIPLPGGASPRPVDSFTSCVRLQSAGGPYPVKNTYNRTRFVKNRDMRDRFSDKASRAGLSVRTLWLRFHSIITLDSNLLAGEQGSGQIRLPALRTTVREGREL